jgi:hypothetical protein
MNPFDFCQSLCRTGERHAANPVKSRGAGFSKKISKNLKKGVDILPGL